MYRSIISVSAIALLLLTEAPDVNAATQKTIAPTVYETPRPTEPTEALTPAPTPCGNRPYYIITIDGVTKCSNGYDANTSESFNSLQKCCNAAQFDNGRCKYIDVCNPTDEPTPAPTSAPVETIITPEPTPEPTPSPTPAPIEEIVTPAPTNAPVTPAPTPCGNRLFYIVTIDGITKCSNGYDSETDSKLFFETSTECCAELIMDGVADCNENCKVVDVCNPTDAPTESPTAAPIETIITPIPTPSPTTPAPIETPVPTLTVTPAPTPCESRKWYLTNSDEDGVTACTNGYDSTIDEASMYNTFIECCEAEATMNGMDSADCKYIDVCNPTDEPTPAPIEAATLPPVPEVVITPPPTM